MRNVLVALGALVGAGLFLQCTSVKDLCMNEECQGYSKEVEAGPECDPVTDPLNCMTPSTGVFVSPKGDDGNDGMQGSPVQTITKAITIAQASGRRSLFLCKGQYTSTVALEKTSTGPISFFGGFDCTTWQYGSANTTQISPPSSDSYAGTALSIKGITSAITISDLEIDSPNVATKEDGTPREDGTSSVAIFVSNSPNVMLRRVTAVAGAGAAGGGGKTGSNYTTDTAAGGNSYSTTNGGTGGALKTCTCKDGTQTMGGEGGSKGAGTPATSGQPLCIDDAADITQPTCIPANGTNVLYAIDGSGGDHADDASDVLSCAQKGALGHRGASGHDGNNGDTPTTANGAVTKAIGSLDDSGWQPAMSTEGKSGGNGQGGGGGGVSGTAGKGSGGGGGCGGCGGAPGSSAQAGGASIALLSSNSTIIVTGCTLTVGQAGSGGNGAPGQPGQYGGGSGSGNPCVGGQGGNGGGGGSSAGGAGGVAAGILWQGTAAQAPSLDEATKSNINPGKEGDFGKGGTECLGGVQPPDCNDGPAGVSGAMLQVEP